jgi:hypothetical protein
VLFLLSFIFIRLLLDRYKSPFFKSPFFKSPFFESRLFSNESRELSVVFFLFGVSYNLGRERERDDDEAAVATCDDDYIYMNIYMHVYSHICMYKYMHIQREEKKGRLHSKPRNKCEYGIPYSHLFSGFECKRSLFSSHWICMYAHINICVYL